MTAARLALSAGLVASLALLAGCDRDADEDRAVVGGDPERGAAIIARVECGVCHAIPGVPGARGSVGPSLAGFADRNLIAGSVPNTGGNLVIWVRDPPSLVPDTAMPPMPIDQAEALDVAAYLLTLR